MRINGEYGYNRGLIVNNNLKNVLGSERECFSSVKNAISYDPAFKMLKIQVPKPPIYSILTLQLLLINKEKYLNM